MSQGPTRRRASEPEARSSRVRAHGLVSGRVQGVGFRFFVLRLAASSALDGYVRNLIDGRVEFEVEGPRSAVEALVGAVRRGPAGAHVVAVEVAWEAPQGESGFMIRTDARG